MLPPPTECPYCGVWFAPKFKNKYGWQKICGKEDCQKQHRAAASRKAIENNKEHYREMWKRNGRQRRAGKLVRVRKFVVDICCHHCAVYYRLGDDNTCPRCKTPFDPERVSAVKKRNDTPYYERVSAAERKLVKANSYAALFGHIRDTNKKLNAYLKGKNQYHLGFNNKRKKTA